MDDREILPVGQPSPLGGQAPLNPPGPLRVQRDAQGFALGDMPHITQDMFHYLCTRMKMTNDMDTCMQMEREERGPFTEWLDRVEQWRKSAEFEQVYQYCLSNRREAFKLLSGYLLPDALLVVESLLRSPNPRSQVKAVEMLGRFQGLFIDRVETISREDIRVLISDLRAPSKAQYIDADGKLVEE